MLSLIGGIAIFLLETNPVGWILTIVGTLINITSSFLTPKEKKRQKAIDKIYNQIKDSILKQAPDLINNVISETDSMLSENIVRIEDLFNDLIEGLNETVSISDQLVESYQTQIEFVNKVYAWRIVQFLKKETALYSGEVIFEDILSVDRNEKGKIIIECSQKQLDTKSLDGIIADKVIIM